MVSSKIEVDEPHLKKLKLDNSSSDGNEYINDDALEKLLFDLSGDKSGNFEKFGRNGPNGGDMTSGGNIDVEIHKLLTLDELGLKNNENLLTEHKTQSDVNSAKPDQYSESPANISPFDSPVDTVTSTNTSVCEDENKQASTSTQPQINKNTIVSIKKSMLDTSKFISTFTTLKTTYLKLCKEFNYLLSKFNENERIKIELINENNELKNLLMEIITEREMEKRKARAHHIESSNHDSASIKRKLADI